MTARPEPTGGVGGDGLAFVNEADSARLQAKRDITTDFVNLTASDFMPVRASDAALPRRPGPSEKSD
jgi:hypothetical protein